MVWRNEEEIKKQLNINTVNNDNTPYYTLIKLHINKLISPLYCKILNIPAHSQYPYLT